MSVNINRLLLLPYSTNFYHSSSVFCKSHYDTLGLTPKATSADVKSAFYRLSKLYHPDTNSNDPGAAEKFREVLDAYEVLSNKLSRTQYDQEGHSGFEGRRSKPAKGFKTPDDPQAAFYKSRLMRRMDNNQKYDFDEWTKSHYRDSFQRVSQSSQRPMERPRTERPQRGEKFRTHDKFAISSFVLASLSLLGIGYLGSLADK